jgi:hypothetical protein
MTTMGNRHENQREAAAGDDGLHAASLHDAEVTLAHRRAIHDNRAECAR